MRIALPLTAAALVMGVAACSESTGPAVEDLAGTWDATEIVYTNSANTSENVDLIDLGASLTVTITASSTLTAAFDDGRGGTSTDSGTLSLDGSTMSVGGITFEAARSGDDLTLTTGMVVYDFDDDGTDEPATLRIRLVRQ